MRDRLHTWVDRLFPGLGVRPLWIASAAAILMTVYEYQGAGGAMPAWFRDASTAFFEVESLRFHQHLWSHSSAVVVLMIVPLILSYAIEGWTPQDLGVRIKGSGTEFLVVLGMWAVMIPIVWLIHDTPSFARMYPRLPEAATDRRLWLMYEGLYLVKWTAWEFFFRGFLLFGFQKDFLSRAVLLSTLPFVVIHFGKPELESMGALLAGLILCFIALRGKSIWPGVLLHWLVATTLDFFASTWWH